MADRRSHTLSEDSGGGNLGFRTASRGEGEDGAAALSTEAVAALFGEAILQFTWSRCHFRRCRASHPSYGPVRLYSGPNSPATCRCGQLDFALDSHEIVCLLSLRGSGRRACVCQRVVTRSARFGRQVIPHLADSQTTCPVHHGILSELCLGSLSSCFRHVATNMVGASFNFLDTAGRRPNAARVNVLVSVPFHASLLEAAVMTYNAKHLCIECTRALCHTFYVVSPGTKSCGVALGQGNILARFDHHSTKKSRALIGPPVRGCISGEGALHGVTRWARDRKTSSYPSAAHASIPFPFSHDRDPISSPKQHSSIQVTSHPLLYQSQ
jgi:hypothetical protein